MQENTRVRVAAVIIRDNAILLVLHQKGGRRYYLLPGGGVEKGEDEAKALKRELMEETGLVVTPGPLLFETHSIRPDGDKRLVQRVYYCTAAGGLSPSQDRRVIQSEFVARSAFPSITFFPNIKAEILDAWESGLEKASFRRLDVKWEE